MTMANMYAVVPNRLKKYKKLVVMEVKEIKVNLAKEQVDEIIKALNVQHEQCFHEQARQQSNPGVRQKLLERFMILGELISLFEEHRMKLWED